MRFVPKQALALFALVVSSAASAFSLDSTNPNNGAFLDLAAGTYNVMYEGGAWNPWGIYNPNVGDCVASGRCRFGWANGFAVTTSQGTTGFGGGFWVSSSLAASAGIAASPFVFSVPTAQKVKVWISDSYYSDNIGSISLSVTPVPEPESYALMLAGLGLLGFMTRRRTRRVV